jgi:hypothetical protein
MRQRYRLTRFLKQAVDTRGIEGEVDALPVIGERFSMSSREAPGNAIVTSIVKSVEKLPDGSVRFASQNMDYLLEEIRDGKKKDPPR